jgi:hypothetical protein
MEWKITTNNEVDKFGKDLAMWLWNIAVVLAPYDTGNLRRAITLNKASDNKMSIKYNAFNALYLHYLEEGMGSVKKHKGFISEDTMMAFVGELIAYFKTGKPGLLVNKPMTTLRLSTNTPMYHERKILTKLGYDTSSSVTADERQMMSQIKYNKLTQSNRVSVGGKKTYVRRLYRRSMNRQIDASLIDDI